MDRHHFLKVQIEGYQSPLHLLSVKGSEQLSRLYEFELAIIPTDLKTFQTIALGTQLSFSIHHRGEKQAQIFHGNIIALQTSGLENAEQTLAKIIMQPPIGFGKQNLRNEAYVNCTVPEIIKKICKRVQQRDLDLNLLSGSYPKLPYYVQYQESDYDFLNRLCAEHGVHYYFDHSKSQSKLIFNDREFPGLSYFQSLVHRNESGGDTSHSFNWKSEKTTHIESYQLSSFNIQNPTKAIQANYKNSTLQNKWPIKKAELCQHNETSREIENRFSVLEQSSQYLQQQSVLKTQVNQIQSNYPQLNAGMQVNLMSEQDPEINDDYYIIAIQHHAKAILKNAVNQETDSKDFYANTISIASTNIAFVSTQTKPTPIIGGYVPALVTGMRKDEAYNSGFHEVKVQPKWDSEHNYDSQSSCWIRVSQGSAGDEWGSQFIPRVGQEVLLSFQQGLHHKHSIIGAVYNKEQRTVFGSKTQWGFKTQSHGGNEDQGHLLKFDDIKGNEKVILKSQKDKHVKVKGHHLKKVQHKSSNIIHARDYKVAVNENILIEAKGKLSLHVGTSKVELSSLGIDFFADEIHVKKNKNV